jgi:uncharacterized membrane protein YccC
VSNARAALRSSMHVDSHLLAPVAGAITAAPVIAIFALGLAFTTTQNAVAMAVGANLIAIVSLIAAPRLSLPLAGLDALAMGLAVFIGTVTGPYPWLHNALLVPWCLCAGMMVVFGVTQGAIGNQAIIAYVVLGRFSGSALTALHLSVFVVVGALVEVAALLLLRLPPSLRYQRSRLANAFEAVAELARHDPHRSAIEVLAVVDEAEQTLSAPALFGRTDVGDLRAVFDQAQRVRLELTTVSGLRVRLLALQAGREIAIIDECLQDVAATLDELGSTLRPRQPSTWRAAATSLRTHLATLDDALPEGDTDVAILARQCVSHLNAIGGQIRSAGTLIDGLQSEDRQRAWRPSLPSMHGIDLGEWQTDFSLIRDNLHPGSSALRHAVRLAVAVPFSALLATWLSLPRGYWLPFAVTVILKPDYSTLISRGVGRLIGTALGAVLAALLVSTLHPNLVLTVVLVAVFAWAECTAWSASFPVAIGFVTALVLILLNTSVNDPLGTALDRLLDVALGGAISVLVYLVWPTSSRAGVSEAHSQLFGALGDYLEVISPLVQGETVALADIAACSRRARVAWAKSEASVGRSVEEPSATRINPSQGRGLLAVTLRILRAIHALRIEAERGAVVEPSPAFDELTANCHAAMRRLSNSFAGRPYGPQTNLRALYRTTEKRLAATDAPPSIAVHLDELVNAINTASLLAGLAAPAADVS